MKAYKLETEHYICGYFKTKEGLARYISTNDDLKDYFESYEDYRDIVEKYFNEEIDWNEYTDLLDDNCIYVEEIEIIED